MVGQGFRTDIEMTQGERKDHDESRRSNRPHALAKSLRDWRMDARCGVTALSLMGGEAFAKSGSGSARPGRSPEACQATARTMLQSCSAEVTEQNKAVLANCLNLSTEDERRQCQSDARLTRREEADLCEEQLDARKDVCDLLEETRYDVEPLTNPALSFVDPDTIGVSTEPNPFLSLEAGQTRVLRGGPAFEETVVIHVTSETRQILGKPCRVIADVVTKAQNVGGVVSYSAVEVTDDWVAQGQSGDLYYCGELSLGYEDGILRNLDGSFEAGIEFAKSGLLIAAAPQVGRAHRQEFSLGEAEDIVQYVSLTADVPAAEGGDNLLFPCAGQCLKTAESIPLEPNAGEFKYYRAGVGFVLAVDHEEDLPTGVRDELVCAGDSLDLLDDPSCGIADPAALRATLCKLSPAAFCAD